MQRGRGVHPGPFYEPPAIIKLPGIMVSPTAAMTYAPSCTRRRWHVRNATKYQDLEMKRLKGIATSAVPRQQSLDGILQRRILEAARQRVHALQPDLRQVLCARLAIDGPGVPVAAPHLGLYPHPD